VSLSDPFIPKESDVRLIWPWEDRNRRFSWLKASGFALVLAPGVRMLWQFAAGDYGILPIAYGGLVYWTGVWATVVLLLALAVTPALKILRWPALIDVRRMIGVAALAYTIFHIIIYFGLRSWRFGFIANESVTRLTLIIAWLSTFGLIVLGATSLDDAIKYMGAKNWQRLHNWNYLISGLAILHIMLARGTYPEQYLLTGLFVWLMAWRVLERYGRGTDVVALTLLAVGLCLFTAFLEAGHFWLIRRYDPSQTLAYNFNPDLWDIAIPPAFKALVVGLLFPLAAAARNALRAKSAKAAAPQVGQRSLQPGS
jgi:sulfoxide reductase heme-binding subunit YedZ